MGRKITIGFIDEDSYDEYHNLLTRGMSMPVSMA